MRTKKVLITAGLMVLIAGVVMAFWLRWSAAPQSARLLPEADAVIYLDLAPLRRAGFLRDLPKVNRDPDFEEFVRQTGFEFERDLDQAAFAVHLPHPDGGNRGYADPRFSEVFAGRFDVEKLTTYFRRAAKNVEHDGNTEIFVLPMEGRTVRIAILSSEKVAVSNLEDPDSLRGIIERAREPGFVRGPELVRNYYRQAPPGSLAWAIGKTSRGSNEGNLTLPEGLELPLPGGTVWVASAKYAGEVQLRGEAFLPQPQDASQLAQNLNLFLTMFRSVQVNVGAQGPDPDVKKFFDSVRVTQEENRAIVAANVSTEFLKKILSQPPAANSSPGEQKNAPRK
jgi:hypothetical protein